MCAYFNFQLDEFSHFMSFNIYENKLIRNLYSTCKVNNDYNLTKIVEPLYLLANFHWLFTYSVDHHGEIRTPRP